MGRFNLEFGIIFKKRWFQLIHSYGIILFISLASVVFTIFTGIISIIIFGGYAENKSSEFGWKELPNGTSAFAYIVDSTQVIPTALDGLIKDVEATSGLTPNKFNTVKEMEDAMYNTFGKYAFGMVIETYTPGLKGMEAFVSKIYYDSTSSFFGGTEAAVNQAIITANLLKHFYLDVTTENITFESEKFNSGLSNARMWSFFGPLLMSFALVNIGAMFGPLLVSDREFFRLYALLSAGLRESVYWFANFVFDFIIYLLVCIINWIILFLFKTDAVVENNWMATFFLFLFVPIQSLPLVYTLTLFFKTHLDATSFLMYILLTLVLIPYFVVTLFLDNDVDEPTMLGLSVIPPYSVQAGLKQCAERSVGKPYDAHEVWTGFMVKIYAIQIGTGIFYGICGVVLNYFFTHQHSKETEDIEADDNRQDKDVAEIEKEVLAGEHDDDVLVIKKLVKAFVDSNGNAFKAVNGVSLYVKEGEIFGILGANGAGKTTLMSVITGRLPATTGEILLCGHKINTPNEAQKYVSVCPQFDTHLFPELTPRQHFQIYGQLKGFNHNDLIKEIQDYEDIMGLSKLMDKIVSQLSPGNTRKLSVALAFLGDAPIVFLDEPTASLDPVARLQAQDLIAVKAHQRTILLCTHLLSEAEKLCARLCIMLTGQLHAIGTHTHLAEAFGTKWKVELGLVSNDEECRNKVNELMEQLFPGCELAGTRFASATYNIPADSIQLPEVFLRLSENKSEEAGFTYFTCSMSTLERVFIDLIMQHEV